MILKKLTVQGFRGINELREIEFAEGITVIHGTNGSGKTSFGEALEWLLFGETSKRRAGDIVSRLEYKGSYRNIHYQGPERPFVETIAQTDGEECTLRRELCDDESSEATLDGEAVTDFSGLGTSSAHDRPMILQHQLQEFIHRRPKDRYKALASMLGLEDLVALRECFDTLTHQSSGYIAHRPPNVEAACSVHTQLVGEAQAFGDRTRTLVESLDFGKGDIQQALHEMQRSVQAEIGDDVEVLDFAEALDNAIAEKQRSVLDWSAFAPHELTGEQRQRIERKLTDELASADDLLRRLQKLPSEQELARARDLRDFYRIGLQLLEDKAADPQLCPFCEESTLTSQRITEIERQARETSAGDCERSQLMGEAQALKHTIGQYPGPESLTPTLPDDGTIRKLRELLGDQYASQVTRFCNTMKGFKEAADRLEMAKQALDAALEHLIGRLKGELPEPDTSDNLCMEIYEYATHLHSVSTLSRGYASEYRQLDGWLAEAISSQDEVRYLELLSRLWGSRTQVRVAFMDAELQTELSSLKTLLRDFTAQKQKESLQTREEDILMWYNLLNPAENVRFSGIVGKKDVIDLLAESFNKRMNAAPNLSESHLNCLGISICLACATRPSTPFRFVLLDDPVLSMDEHHAERLRIEVMQKLLDDGFQVILTTYLSNYARKLADYYRGTWDVTHLDFIEYTHDGPRIEERGPELNELLKQAKENHNAPNAQFRKIAVTALRQFVERFVKNLYSSQTGQDIPRKYRNAQWRELIALLRQCPDFDVDDERHLADTHDFTSKYLHTDENTPDVVPERSVIEPHVSRLENLLRKYKAEKACL